jgi:hypothetical protein
MAQAADLHPPPAGVFDHFDPDFHRPLLRPGCDILTRTMVPLGAWYVSSVSPSDFMGLSVSAALTTVVLPASSNATAKEEEQRI